MKIEVSDSLIPLAKGWMSALAVPENSRSGIVQIALRQQAVSSGRGLAMDRSSTRQVLLAPEPKFSLSQTRDPY